VPARVILYVVQRLLSGLWFLPAVMVVGGIVLAFVMVMVDRSAVGRQLTTLHWIFEIDAEGARLMLATMAGSLITATSLVASLVLLVLTLAFSQLGPRLLGDFMRDHVTQFVLGPDLHPGHRVLDRGAGRGLGARAVRWGQRLQHANHRHRPPDGGAVTDARARKHGAVPGRLGGTAARLRRSAAVSRSSRCSLHRDPPVLRVGRVSVTVRLIAGLSTLARYVRREEDRQPLRRHAAIIARTSRRAVEEPVDRQAIARQLRAFRRLVEGPKDTPASAARRKLTSRA
jgi:hypothetical protein